MLLNTTIVPFKKSAIRSSCKQLLQCFLIVSILLLVKEVGGQTVSKNLYLTPNPAVPTQALTRTVPTGTTSQTVTLYKEIASIPLSSSTSYTTGPNPDTGPKTAPPITISSGPNRLLLVGIGYEPNSTNVVTSVTLGTVSLTRLGEITNGTSTHVEIWYLKQPAAGTGTISVNWTGGLELTYGAVVFENVDQVNSFGTISRKTESNSGSFSQTLATSSGDVVFDIIARAGSGTNPAIVSGQTLVFVNGSNSVKVGASTKTASSATTTTSLGWTNASTDWAGMAVSLKGFSNEDAEFTLTPNLCTNLTIPSTANITIKAYASVVTGTIPANPSVIATLRYGTSAGGYTTFLETSAPTWTASGTTEGFFTWTGTVSSTLTIPTGNDIKLLIANDIENADFKVEYGSAEKNSFVTLPTTPAAGLTAVNIYDAPTGGSIIPGLNPPGTAYIIGTATGTFGAYDITGMTATIVPPSPGTATTVTMTELSTTGCVKTFLYTWTLSESASQGVYTITTTTTEGTEGTATSTASTSLLISKPYGLTKVLSSPASGPYVIGDKLTYLVTIENTGTATITSIPLQDIYATNELFYVSSTSTPTSIGGGVVSWLLNENLSPGASKSVSVTFEVRSSPSPLQNSAKVEGLVANGITQPSLTVSTETDIQSPPVAVPDTYSCIATPTAFTLDVLSNDTDNDLGTDFLSSHTASYTLIVTQPTAGGTVTVNGNGTLTFSPTTSIEDKTVTFTYIIQEAAYPTDTRFADTTTVTFYYSGENAPVTAVDDNISSTMNYPVVVNVLGNDIGGDGGLSTPVILTPPKFGRVVVNANKTITYFPSEDFIGEDVFTYEVCDNPCPSPQSCSTATVTISISDGINVCKQSTTTLTVPAISDAQFYTWTLPANALVVGSTVTETTVTSTTNTLSVDWTGVAAGTYSVCVFATNDCGESTSQCMKLVVNEVLLSAVPTDVKCFGGSTGSIDLTPIGGVLPYTFAWSGPEGYKATIEDIAALKSGTYSVVVSDNSGCSATQAYVVSEIASSALSLTSSFTDEIYDQNDGSASVFPTGGSAPYTYLWTRNGSGDTYTASSIIQNLTGGTYKIVVTDAQGCTEQRFITVNAIGAPLEITLLEPTPVLCKGAATGSVDLEVIGGFGVYSYTWSTASSPTFATSQDLSGVPAGIYTVTIVEGTTSITTSVEVTEPAMALSSSLTSPNSPICYNTSTGNIDLTPIGGTAPYTFLWNTGATTEDLTNIKEGTYSVTIKDANGCEISNNVTVTQTLEITFSSTFTNTSCADSDGAISITNVGGGDGTYTYVWSDGVTSTTSRSGLSTGTYAVTISSGGCSVIKTFKINKTCLEISKVIINQPINKSDGTFELTYRIAVTNAGDEVMNNVKVVDNLQTTFSGATTFTVTSLISEDFQENVHYAKSDDFNLVTLPGGSLYPNETGYLTLTVLVTTGSKLGIYTNVAEVEGTDPNGFVSKKAADKSITFEENPQIGISKLITEGPLNNGDGTYSLTYTFKVQNTGDVPLTNVQLFDDLSGTFGVASNSIAVNSITSENLTVNPAYNGSTITATLAGGNVLAVNQIETVVISITVTPTSTQPNNNTAIASGDSPSGLTETDLSDNGILPDGNSNRNPNDDSDPTPVTFIQNPAIGLAKRLAEVPTKNGDGSYTLTYIFEVKNTGDVPLSNIKITDNLVSTFTASSTFQVLAITASPGLSLNASYTGVVSAEMSSTSEIELLSPGNTLGINETGTVSLTLKVYPVAAGTYSNTAEAEGFSQFNTLVDDISHDGSDVDPDNDGAADNSEPTPVTFAENPGIGLAKRALEPVNLGDGRYELIYEFFVKNTGDVTLSNVQVIDNLAATFTGSATFSVTSVSATASLTADTDFDGTTKLLLLKVPSVLSVGETASISLKLIVTPGPVLGVYNNTATATGVSPDGEIVEDKSTNGNAVDPNNDGSTDDNSQLTPISFEENPELTVTKLFTSETGSGTGPYTITYTIRAQNTGDIQLNNVQLDDDLSLTFPGAEIVSTAITVTASPTSNTGLIANADYTGTNTSTLLLNGTGSLMPNEYVDVQLTAVVNSLSGGLFYNTALGYATSVAGDMVGDNSTASVSINEIPQVGLAKDLYSLEGTSTSTVFTVTFELTVQNTGNVRLTDLVIYDDIVAQFGTMSPTGIIAFVPDEIQTAVTAGTYTQNILSASSVWSGTSTSSIIDEEQELDPGQTGKVWIRFSVTPGTVSTKSNTATVEAMSSSGTVSDTSEDGLDVDPDSGADEDPTDNNTPTPIIFPIGVDLEVVKSVTPSSQDVGSNVSFSIAVTNNGPSDATGVKLTDNLPNGFTYVSHLVTAGTYTTTSGVWDISSLANGSTVTLTIVATVNEPGSGVGYTNTASITSVDQIDLDLTNNTDDAVVTALYTPSLSIEKTARVGTYDGAGDVITYDLVVTNTGNVTLSDVVVTDALTSLTETISTLLVGDTYTITTVYTVTQSDVDAGVVTNTADAISTFSGTLVSDTDDEVVSITQTPSISLVKTAGVISDIDGDGKNSAGDEIVYTFEVKNTGNVTLSDINITDEKLGLSGATALEPLQTTLLPGSTTTASAVYVLTQSDVDAGVVTNTAIAAGSGPGATGVVTDTSDDVNHNDTNPSTSDDAPTMVLLLVDPSISLVKTAGLISDKDGDGRNSAGDELVYTFEVKNTGNVTLSGINITDEKLGLSGATALEPLQTTLLPGSTTTASAVYVLTQSDVDAGVVTNTAIAAGSGPGATVVITDTSDDVNHNDDDPSTTDDAPTVVNLTRTPSISLVKTAGLISDKDGDGRNSAGDEIVYTFEVKNTGNVTLTNVILNDAMIGWVNRLFTPATLVPGAVASMTAVYPLTQTDVDNGSIVNTAMAEGAGPAGTEKVTDVSDFISLTQDRPTVVPVKGEPSIALIKTIARVVDVDGNGRDSEGDQVVYTFTVKNTGNVILSNLRIEDALTGSVDLPTTPSFILPGETAVAEAYYSITGTDVTVGEISNSAKVFGETKLGQLTDDVSDSASYVGSRPTVYVLRYVIAQPSDILLVDTAFCSGGSATLRANTNSVSNPMFKWYRDAALTDLVYVGSTYTTGPLTETTRYYVSVEGALVLPNASNNGQEVTVTVYPATPTPTVTVSGPTALCPGASVVLTSSTATTYQWLRDGVTITGATTRTYTTDLAGSYTVATTNVNGCAGPLNDAVIISAAPVPPKPVITADKVGICIGDNAVLTSDAPAGNQWYKDGVAISGATAERFVVYAAGQYTVVVTNSNGCISSISNPVNITVNALPAAPEISINGTTKYCPGETRTIKAVMPAGMTIKWFRDGAAMANATADSIVVGDAANYNATFTNANGCVSSASNIITTEVGCTPNIIMPDVFTPNQDGINDVIKPIIPGIQNFRCFKVFNRWGNLIFETTDRTKGWDGRYRGADQPADSYIWLVEGVDFNGKEIKRTGFFMLLR